MLCEFGLKMPVHVPLGEFFGVKLGNGDFRIFIYLGTERAGPFGSVHLYRP